MPILARDLCKQGGGATCGTGGRATFRESWPAILAPLSRGIRIGAYFCPQGENQGVRQISGFLGSRGTRQAVADPFRDLHDMVIGI